MKNLDSEFMAEIVGRWTLAVAAEEEMPPRMPVRVFTGEALDVAQVVEKHYEDDIDNRGKPRLGLHSAGERSGITPTLAAELRELSMAVGDVQGDYVRLAQKLSSAPIERAEHVLSELKAVLSFVLEAGDTPDGAAQLAQLREAYDNTSSHDGLALALQGYAGLAEEHQDVLAGIGGISEGVIDEAIQLAYDLRQRSADRKGGEFAQEQRDILALRNRLISALYRRMTAARRAIRFVFRDYPDVVEKASSDYLRNNKRRSRERAAEVITGNENTLELATPQLAE
jgi:hypothetical protein